MRDDTKTEVFGDGTKTELFDNARTEMVAPPKADKVVSLRYVRIGSLLLAIICIPFLYLLARLSAPEDITIQQVDGAMQSAFVRLEGVMLRDARIVQRPQGVGEVTLYMEDKTGVIAIRAFRNVAKNLVLNGNVPRLGDLVQVSGMIKADNYGEFYLLLKDADSLIIKPHELPLKTLAQIKAEDFKGAAHLTVQVNSYQRPPADTKRPWVFTVTDGSVTMDLIIWNSLIEPVLPLAWGAGARLDGRFVVGSFKGQSQLAISAIKDINLVTPGADIQALATNNGAGH